MEPENTLNELPVIDESSDEVRCLLVDLVANLDRDARLKLAGYEREEAISILMMAAAVERALDAYPTGLVDEADFDRLSTLERLRDLTADLEAERGLIHAQAQATDTSDRLTPRTVREHVELNRAALITKQIRALTEVIASLSGGERA